MTHKIFQQLIVFALFLAGSLFPRESLAETAIVIANDVARDIGSVSLSNDGKKGAAIVIFEERHTDIAGDIEQAIGLLRLKSKYGLKDIGLEGYHENSKEISTEWFVKLPLQTDEDKFSTALALLARGEASSSEFMALAFGTTIHRIERSQDYVVPPENFGAIIGLAYSVGLTRLQPALASNETLSGQVEDILKDLKTATTSAARLDAQKRLESFLVSNDAWTAKMLGGLKQNDNERAIVTAIDNVKGEAKAQNFSISPNAQKALDDNRAFFQGRDNANQTMVGNIAKVADQPGTKVVAMIVGGAHTSTIASLLRNQDRPFAVVSTTAYKNRDKLSSSSSLQVRFNRKFAGLSAADDAISDDLLKVFPLKIKPQPSVGLDWFQAEAELHHAMRRAAELYLTAPPPPPPPPGTSPKVSSAGPPDGSGLPFIYKGTRVEFNGNYKYTDLGKAVIVQAAMLGEKNQSQVIWIKLSRIAGSTPAVDQEKKLFAALAAVESPPPDLKPKPEKKPKVQVVRLDNDYKAEIADDPASLN